MKLRFLYRAWKARLRDQRLEIAIAEAFIRRGDLVVDAGANKGAYVYWLRRFAGASGTVLAFEPQPELAGYLQNISQSLRWTNVDVRPVALSNRAGRSTLHVPGSGVSPGASLGSSVLDHADGRRFECVVDTLDEHLKDDDAPLKFLKVDVEGHELALFQGAEARLNRDRPPILFECEERHLSKHSMQDVFRFLGKLQYRGYLLTTGCLLPATRFDPAVHQRRGPGQFWNAPDYFNNFLFVAQPLPAKLEEFVRS